MKLTYNESTHSYWLDGKRVKSASKVAQITADSFTVEQWMKRQVTIGMTLAPELAERVAVDLDNREAIQKVCDDAANTAKANARANRGTQRHRVFEMLLLGQRHALITDQQRADAEVLARTLDAYGLEPIPDRVEQFVAWPKHGVVGRYDAYLGHEGRPVLVDLKGGPNAVKYPHSTAVQEWLYRFAPFTSAAIERDGDKSTVTEWTTAPDGADEEVGYVLYCDDHHEVGELWRIDLTGARRGGELALGVVGWRKAHNYGKDLASPISIPTDDLCVSVSVLPGPVTSPVNSEGSSRGEAPFDSGTGQPSTTDDLSVPVKLSEISREDSSNGDHKSSIEQIAAPVPPEQPPAAPGGDVSRRQVLSARYKMLSEDQQRIYIRRKAGIDTDDLDAVEALLAECEPFMQPATARCSSCSAPIIWAVTRTGKRMPIDAQPSTEGNLLLSDKGIVDVHEPGDATDFDQLYYVSHFATCPNANAHRGKPRQRFTGDEGPDASEQAVADIRTLFNELTDEQRAPIAAVVVGARETVGGFLLSQRPSLRRWEIYRGLITLARFGWDDDVVRACAARATSDPAVLQPGVPLGTVVGMLNCPDAERFADIAAELARGTLALDFSTGACRLGETVSS